MHHNLDNLYSIKIKGQTRKLGAGCSKHRFEVVDRTDEVSSKHGFEVVDKPTLTWFEEIFEEYYSPFHNQIEDFPP